MQRISLLRATSISQLKCVLPSSFTCPLLASHRLFSTKRAAPVQHETRIVSGIQPTGRIHLGNYLGAVATWVKLQNGTFTPTSPTQASLCKTKEGQPPPLFIFLADLHALTLAPDPKLVRKSCYDVTAQLLACGIDPAKTCLFMQGDISAHQDLAWITACQTQYSLLTRQTQFKDKSKTLKNNQNGPDEIETIKQIQTLLRESLQKSDVNGSRELITQALPLLSDLLQSESDSSESEGPSLGLFTYPNLQAADILLYRATGVPVGEDQFQHIELCREVARRYNKKYASQDPSGFTLPIPQHIATVTPRVMSLQDGTKKMSKSDISDLTRINITDTADMIVKKIKKATTDSLPGIKSDPNHPRPNVENLIRIFSAVSGRTIQDIENDPALQTIQTFKPALTEQLVQLIAPISAEYERISKDPAYIERVLREGSDRAREVAVETISRIRPAVGLISTGDSERVVAYQKRMMADKMLAALDADLKGK